MLDYFFKGGILMYPIALCSIVALAAILDRTLAFGRERRRGDLLASLQRRAASMPCAGREQLEAALSLEGALGLKVLSRRLSILELVAKISPMLGLLGTVLGLCDTFREVAAAPGGADPAILAGGIWEALITTVGGLFVAIPAIVCHHGFARSLAGLRFELKVGAERILIDRMAAARQPSTMADGEAR